LERKSNPIRRLYYAMQGYDPVMYLLTLLGREFALLHKRIS
jgi:hypothetical protein